MSKESDRVEGTRLQVLCKPGERFREQEDETGERSEKEKSKERGTTVPRACLHRPLGTQFEVLPNNVFGNKKSRSQDSMNE